MRTEKIQNAIRDYEDKNKRLNGVLVKCEEGSFAYNTILYSIKTNEGFIVELRGML